MRIVVTGLLAMMAAGAVVFTTEQAGAQIEVAPPPADAGSYLKTSVIEANGHISGYKCNGDCKKGQVCCNVFKL